MKTNKIFSITLVTSVVCLIIIFVLGNKNSSLKEEVLLNREEVGYQKSCLLDLQQNNEMLYKYTDLAVDINSDSLKSAIKFLSPSNFPLDNTLVLRFTQAGCWSCIKQICHIMDEIRDYPLISNMIFVVDSYSEKDKNRIKSLLGEGSNIVFVNDINYEFDQNNAPYFFILDSDFKAKKLFIPHLRFPEATSEYLQYLLTLNS